MKRRERELRRASEKRRRVSEHKLKSGCVDCGYNKDARALEFDHRENAGLPYTGKQQTVASLMYRSWKRIEEEMKKCDVVCCNCHAIRTAERRAHGDVGAVGARQVVTLVARVQSPYVTQN